jgi:hypothetical protein
MGGSSHETQQQQSTQTNTIDPEQKALLMGNYATAQANASKLDTPYGGLLTAGFNPTQYRAQGLFSALGTDPSFMNNANKATAAIGGVLGGSTGQPYSASQLAGMDLSQYQNPYTKDVINTTLDSQEHARQMQRVADNASATAAHAFGGSRQGVADSLTNSEYDRNTAGLLAGLNQANYGQAQQSALSDIGAQNAAKQFNVNSGLQDASLKLNAAGALQSANNNALATGTQQAGLLGAVGDVQQQQQQTELSNAYQNWLAGQQMTVTQQQMLNSALGLMPAQQTINSSGTGSANKTSSPGVTDILGGIGSAGMGLGSMGLGFADGRGNSEPLRFDAGRRRWASFRYTPELSDLREAA